MIKTPMADRYRSALIDLGSNSARLLIVEVTSNGLATIMHQEKRPVRLGEGSFLDRKLTEEAMLRASAALSSFQKTARAFEVDIIKAVATSAAREAENRADFVHRVYEDSGLWLKVISGLEEARLIYLGVAQSLNLGLGSGKTLIVDIGGGSLELIVGDRQDCDYLDSLPLGAARLTEMFNFNADDGLVSPEKYGELVDYVIRHTRRFSEEARKFDLKSAYGSSGTIRNLAQINHHRREAEGIRPRQAPTLLAAGALRDLGLWLGGMDFKTRRKVGGLDSQKVKIIVAGCAALEAVLTALEIEELTAVDYGLKHGLLYEFAAEHKTDDDRLSTRENSVRNLGRRCCFDEAHALNTARWARSILAEFTAADLLTDNEQHAELVCLAAQLHDIGKFFAYENHQIHSWYLIKNTSLAGFDEEEIDLMAFLALHHKKRRKKEGWPYCYYLNRADYEYRQKLGLVLRLAEVIDSSRQGLVRSFSLQRFGSQVTCFLKTGAGDDSNQEVTAVAKLTKDLGTAFGLDFSLAVI